MRLLPTSCIGVPHLQSRDITKRVLTEIQAAARGQQGKFQTALKATLEANNQANSGLTRNANKGQMGL